MAAVRRRPARGRHLAAPLGSVSGHVRRRAHQDSRRLLLARSHLHGCFHYETQPLPNPVELVPAPPRPPLVTSDKRECSATISSSWISAVDAVRRPRGGCVTSAACSSRSLFQVLLIVSGNLSWLNWLTLTLCVACFDEAACSLASSLAALVAAWLAEPYGRAPGGPATRADLRASRVGRRC